MKKVDQTDQVHEFVREVDIVKGTVFYRRGTNIYDYGFLALDEDSEWRFCSMKYGIVSLPVKRGASFDWVCRWMVSRDSVLYYAEDLAEGLGAVLEEIKQHEK